VVWHLAPQRLLRVCLWIALGALLLRCVLAEVGISWDTLYSNTACRMDALALGGAGACVLRIPDLRQRLLDRLPAISILVVVVLLAGLPLTHIYDRDRWTGQTLGYTLLAFGSATFVTGVAALSGDRRRAGLLALLSLTPLRSCGKYSYAMYVFHMILHQWLGEPWLVRRFGEHPSVPVAFAYAFCVLAASYVLGFLSYHALEKPFLKLKRFFDSA
jgi:peptidoglycan/LPS O-acetylase OafA/YrhL